MRSWHLQIEPGTWVLWGYGPRARSAVHVDRAKVDLGYGIVLPFKLPKESLRGVSDSKPQEYERRKGYGWRWNIEDGTAGHSWSFANSIENAVKAARQSAEFQQRLDSQEMLLKALDDVRIGGIAKPRRR